MTDERIKEIADSVVGLLQTMIEKRDFDEQWRNAILIPAKNLGEEMDCLISFSVHWQATKQ